MRDAHFKSQCTFWCSVLSDYNPTPHRRMGQQVSMHLLVLSAFRPGSSNETTTRASSGLNAPSGAQCFPTLTRGRRIFTKPYCLNAPSGAQCFPTPQGGPLDTPATSLNAPSGAQCFPTSAWLGVADQGRVSMHLLVLSAFRRGRACVEASLAVESQCTFWCSVLSDAHGWRTGDRPLGSQCTFWCSVLSDDEYVGQDTPKQSLNAPSGAQCFPTRKGPAS